MSDGKITAEVKTQKIKDPRRVEQGKRLAAISREEKEAKRKVRERAEVNKENIENADMLYLTVGAAAVGGLAYGAYRYLYTIKEEPEHEEQQPNKKVPKLGTLD